MGTAQTMLNMLNPKLKKILDGHPDMAKQFTEEMNHQLETVRSDPEALKALREEMEADVKDLNEQVDRDPTMLKMIESNLAGKGAAPLATASMELVLPAVNLAPVLPGTASLRGNQGCSTATRPSQRNIKRVEGAAFL